VHHCAAVDAVPIGNKFFLPKWIVHKEQVGLIFLASRMAWPVPTAMTFTFARECASFPKAGMSTSNNPEFCVLVVDAITSVTGDVAMA
jgi:hypothetical protein